MTRDLVGGHPGLDLVNTVWWRLDSSRRVDRIPDLQSFLVWARRAGLGPIGEIGEIGEIADDRVIAAVHVLREDAHAVLAAHVARAPVPGAPLRAMHVAGAEAMARAEPAPGLPLRWVRQAGAPDDVPDVVAASLIDLLAHHDLTYLRVCADEACGWLYLDRSRNHSRRWCSSAECGNRHRVNEFAARRSGSSS